MPRMIGLIPAVVGTAMAAFVAYVAFRVGGFIGVALLGLLIGFIALRVEVEKDGPVGSIQNTSLYADVYRSREHWTRSERAAADAETASLLRGTRLAKALGAVLVVVGVGGFFLFQLRS